MVNDRREGVKQWTVINEVPQVTLREGVGGRGLEGGGWREEVGGRGLEGGGWREEVGGRGLEGGGWREGVGGRRNGICNTQIGTDGECAICQP